MHGHNGFQTAWDTGVHTHRSVPKPKHTGIRSPEIHGRRDLLVGRGYASLDLLHELAHTKLLLLLDRLLDSPRHRAQELRQNLAFHEGILTPPLVVWVMVGLLLVVVGRLGANSR